MGGTDERLVRLRIRLDRPAPRSFCGYEEIEGGIQVGRDVLAGELDAEGCLRLTAELRARRDPVAGVRFLGEYAFGPPRARFLYVSWSHTRDGRREMFRRMKIPLTGISWDQVEAVAASADQLLEAIVPGVARDGGPACASVSIAGGWQIRPVQSHLR